MSPEEIASPINVKQINKWKQTNPNDPCLYISRTPYHVKGSLVYNKLIDDSSLNKDYELINEYDHIKTICLKKHNPVGSLPC